MATQMSDIRTCGYLCARRRMFANEADDDITGGLPCSAAGALSLPQRAQDLRALSADLHQPSARRPWPRMRACWWDFPPGGSLDVVARLLVEHMKGYAPSLIVDNRPGAGGRIALEALKSGEPDGSLLALTPGDQVTLFPHVYQKLSYDTLRDFVPVTTVCTFPFLLAIGPMVPSNVTTLAQFIEWCRANPKLATYGSPGAGTRPHFLGVTLARAAGIEFVHLPYKGGAPAIQDLLGGQIPATISVFANAFPHVQSGSLRALAITAPQRSPLLPNVPTAREAGYPGMEAVEWFGLFAPAKTPIDIVSALHAAVQQALAD